MGIKKEKLKINEKLLSRIIYICQFNKAKVEFINGMIFSINKTNLNILEPHRFIISIKDIKLILLCYDNLNIHLYERNNILSYSDLKKILNWIGYNKLDNFYPKGGMILI